MIVKVLGVLAALAVGLPAVAGTLYTVGVDHRTGRLIRVPSRQTRPVAARAVAAAPIRETVVVAREVRPLDPAAPASVGNVVPARSLDELIARTAYAHGIKPSFVHAVIRAESNYNPRAISQKGAMGLMQLMPHTARRFGVRNVFDPAQNVEGGVRYLRHLLDLYDDHKLALAAYNAGEGAVDRFGGIPPYLETRLFVPRVIRYYSRLGSFDRPPEPAPKRFDGPRIFQITDSTTGVIRYTTESQ